MQNADQTNQAALKASFNSVEVQNMSNCQTKLLPARSKQEDTHKTCLLLRPFAYNAPSGPKPRAHVAKQLGITYEARQSPFNSNFPVFRRHRTDLIQSPMNELRDVGGSVVVAEGPGCLVSGRWFGFAPA